MPSTASATANLVRAFAQGLRQHGYVPGQSIAVTHRYTDGHAEQVRSLARELVEEGNAVIVTTTDAVVRIVAREAPRTAIVMVNAADPVGNGLVASLAHPGGNVTGLTNLSPEITGKRVQLLRECVPAISRLGYLWNPALAGASDVLDEVRLAAGRFHLELQPLEARGKEELAPALAWLAGRGASGLLVQAPNPLFYTERTLLCGLAAERRLPAMFNRVEYVEAGGLLSYGPDVPEMYRRSAAYVHRILEGAKPADLPVEQPSKFELAVNLDTARTLGISVPSALRERADRLIG
jgi:putative ABC transport system substrate-binding protein